MNCCQKCSCALSKVQLRNRNRNRNQNLVRSAVAVVAVAVGPFRGHTATHHRNHFDKEVGRSGEGQMKAVAMGATGTTCNQVVDPEPAAPVTWNFDRLVKILLRTVRNNEGVDVNHRPLPSSDPGLSCTLDTTTEARHA
jgi:hypothetical protein